MLAVMMSGAAAGDAVGFPPGDAVVPPQAASVRPATSNAGQIKRFIG
jgi:hypothetical protein